MEPNDSSNVTLVGGDGQTEAHKVCSTSNSTEEHFETTGNVTTEEGLSRQQKQCLSRLYRTGEKKSKTSSHINYLCKCRDIEVVTKGFELSGKRFVGNKKRIEKCSNDLMDIAIDHFSDALEKQTNENDKALDELKTLCNEQTFSSLNIKFQSSMRKREQSNKLKKESKLMNATNDKRNAQHNKDREKSDGIVEMAREFFENVEKPKRKRRKRKEPSKSKIVEKKKLKRMKLRQKKSLKMRQEEVNSEHSGDDTDPLGVNEETIEDIFGQFFTNIEAIKVKNLSNIPMSESVRAFLSLGAKFCPNELDIDRAQLEKDLEAWFRRLRLKANFEDKEDLRTEEEKRFYMKSSWTPQAGKFVTLDMFIYRIRKRFDEWVVPKRIKDNMTKAEREGMEEVKNDGEHIYRMEDKGSCIVRIKAEDYEKNAKNNLAKGNQYEKLNSDPTNQTVEKVKEFIDKLKENEHIRETTAEVIKGRTNDCIPGAYTEQPKTHKFKEETHDLSNGFPARGIISCKRTPTESLQDYVDFVLNSGMKKLPSFLKDTKHVLQKLHERNERGPIEEEINLVTADFENMYGLMPLELSKKGVKKHLEARVDVQNKPTTDEALNALDLCQQNNVFEFDGELYRQLQGHGTGQKQAPPVACLGAGEVEEEFLSLPGVRELMDIWGRYIDDIFSLFYGDEEKCREVFSLLNNLYPGQIKVTWEFSKKIFFIINREKQIL